MRALIIEDNKEIVENMYDFFDDPCYTLDSAQDGLTGLHLATSNQYDIIILDLALPGMDGISLCKRIREDGCNTTPIIMLTARHTTNDKIIGLKAGADDYLVKPFSLLELQARMGALVRRNKEYDSGSIALRVGDLEYQLSTLEVKRENRIISMPPVLLTILETLMRRSPNVVTRGELEFAIWGDSPPESDALRTHIHALRTVIDKPFKSDMIMTIHGIGFRLLDSHE